MRARQNKDRSILDVLTLLRRDLGGAAFVLVDHWEDDLAAVGIARADNERVLAYISTYGLAPGRYYLELETPGPSADTTDYHVVQRSESMDYEALCRAVAKHFGVASRPRGSHTDAG